MNVNFSFLAHLKYRLYAYIAVLIVVPAFIVFSIGEKNKPKDFEKFHIFVGAEVVNKSELKKDVGSILSEDLEIIIESYSEIDSLFQTKLDSFGRTSDILVMSKTTLQKQQYIPYVNLSSTNKYYSDTNFVAYERNIGILINGEKDSYLSNYYNLHDEPYYALISNSTVHGEGFLDNYKTNQVEKVLSLFLSK